MSEFLDPGGEPLVVPDTYMKVGDDVVSAVSSVDPSGMRISDLRYKGYVQVWDTETGVLSLQPWSLMWQTMRKTRPDGSAVFTRTNPNIPPNHGADLFCPLHPESPDAKALHGMGFKPCRKRHIPHDAAVMQHLRSSHKRAYEAIERARAERQRQEDRALQVQVIETNNRLMEAVLANQAATRKA